MRITALFSLLVFPCVLSAQVPASTRPVQLVVSGGLQVPTGSFADFHDAGVHADVSLLITALGLRLRPEMSFSRFNIKEAFNLPTLSSRMGGAGGASAQRDAYTDALSTMLSGFANIELPLGSGGFQPFLLGGVGAVRLASDATVDALSVSDIQASLNVGAGIRFRLGGVSGLIEARLNNVPGADTRAFFKDVRTVPVTFGLVF